MSWDDDKFERFISAAVQMARGALPGYGYSHVVFPYPPEAEGICIQKVRSLPNRFSAAGLKPVLLPVAPEMAIAAAKWANRPLTKARDYERLEKDLSDLRDGLVTKVATACARTIAEHPPDTVVIVTRVGALYPFCHLSTLLSSLVSAGVRNTLAVTYPGTADGTNLRFLGKQDPTGGYRGHVVT